MVIGFTLKMGVDARTPTPIPEECFCIYKFSPNLKYIITKWPGKRLEANQH
jgi:hypothetical protein